MESGTDDLAAMIKRAQGKTEDFKAKTLTKTEQAIQDVEQKTAEGLNHLMRDIANTHQFVLTLAKFIGVDASTIAVALHDPTLKDFHNDIGNAEQDYLKSLANASKENQEAEANQDGSGDSASASDTGTTVERPATDA